MFILIFFLVISISQFVSNKMINLSDDSEDAYTFTKKDSLIIVILFVVGIVLQIVSKMLLTSFYWVAAGIYLFASLILMLIILQTRKTQLLQQREQLQQVYDILQKLVDKKGEGLDFNNPPFTLEYKYGNVQRIVVPVDPVALADVKDLTSAMVPYMAQLDNFLPTYKWTFEKHLEQRYIEFIGEDKPPTLAKWPGSWLRNYRFMPVGISGKGEIGFTADDIKKADVGRSLFKNEEGEYIPQDTTLPKQPQSLICGATGGGKSVFAQNLIYHVLEHRDKLAIALVDPKIVEFSAYNGMNGILGVANSTLEACEILRIARQVMYKRNKELKELGLKNVGEFTPTKRSGKVFVTGKEVSENDTLKVRIESEEKQMKAVDVADYLDEDHSRIIDVSFVDDIWIPINNNCCSIIYEDEMKTLIVLVDELAELTQKSGQKDALSKEQDLLKAEIMGILQSIAQLGRSAGIHLILATQRPSADVVPTILRNNLGFRAFCGRAAEAGASMVALDNTLATTIEPKPPGMAIVQSAGVPVFLRTYFSEFKDLQKYYSDRGLDSMGYDPNAVEEAEVLQTLGGTEELSMDDESIEFEFESEKARIDKKQDQVFTEI